LIKQLELKEKHDRENVDRLKKGKNNTGAPTDIGDFMEEIQNKLVKFEEKEEMKEEQFEDD
jgi:hypothetical protein